MKNELKIQIIIKLARRGYWGHRLINFSDLLSFVPRHLRKLAKICIKELYKEGFLNRKPGIQKEFRYSLSLQMKKEIDSIIMYKNYAFKR